MFENRLLGVYPGAVEYTISPEKQKMEVEKQWDSEGYQHEYMVKVTLDNMSQASIRCIVMDYFGGIDDYSDRVFENGHRVFVVFPNGDSSMGLIIGTTRQFKEPQTETRGRYFERRFGGFTETIEEIIPSPLDIKNPAKIYSWTFKHDDGPFMEMDSSSITITDGMGGEIIIDKLAQKISVNSIAMAIDVKTNCTLSVGGNVDIKTTTGNVSIDTMDAKITCKKNAEINCLQAKVTAKAKVEVKAPVVEINKKTGGQAITTMTQPTCYVSGIPFKGTPDVFIG